jgi:hypothetical protein
MVVPKQPIPEDAFMKTTIPQLSRFLQRLLRDDLLGSFAGVYIQDSSHIDLPAGLHTLWQRNNAGQATLKLHAVLDYQHGQFDLTRTSGRAHDCPLQTVDLPAGSLRLADLGYFKVKVFEQLDCRGVWWVSRLPARAIWALDAPNPTNPDHPACLSSKTTSLRFPSHSVCASPKMASASVPHPSLPSPASLIVPLIFSGFPIRTIRRTKQHPAISSIRRSGQAQWHWQLPAKNG